MQYNLSSQDPITTQVRSMGVKTWSGLIQYVRSLPYGRNLNREDLSLVFSEQKGTCSSKHAVLKLLADRNAIPDVKLILGLYQMNEKNTPGIGNEMRNSGIDYLPEAHCYLQIEGKRIDVTHQSSSFDRISSAIISEIEINPDQTSNFKVEYHKVFIKGWLVSSSLDFNFDQIWSIREKCIMNLSNQ